MKLSDAVLAGAGVLKTRGPEHTRPGEPVNRGHLTALRDVLTAAQIGLLGRIPTMVEAQAFYFDNPWGATHGTDLEYWTRMTIVHGYTWRQVIEKLRGYGA